MGVTFSPERLVVGLTYDNDYANDPGLDEIQQTLEELGHRVHRIGHLQSLVMELAAVGHNNVPWNLVFNLAGGSQGSSRELQIPSLLDAYNVAHTFATASVMAICGDKAMTKMVLQNLAIPTAPFCVVPGASDFSDRSEETWQQSFSVSSSGRDYRERHDLLGALFSSGKTVFVKPTSARSSAGIDHRNEVSTSQQLNMLVHRLRYEFPGQDMLVETYLWGREFTVAIIGSGKDAYILAILEIHVGKSSMLENGKRGGVYDADMKSGANAGCEFTLADSSKERDSEAAAAGRLAVLAWNALGCRDAGRVDVRSDVRGPDACPHVIEVSPMAGIKPKTSKLAMAADLTGLGYEGLLNAVITHAAVRIQNDRLAS